MSIDALKSLIPDYAKDVRLNLSTLSGEDILNSQQKWGVFLATALASRNPALIRAIAAEAARHLSPEALEAAKAAHAVMAMNNVYYKFTGMMGEEYRTIPARLRMNVIADPGVEKEDFELWALAVSAINGCQFCVKSHEKKLAEGGFTREQIQAAVRIASAVYAASCVIGGEEALSPGGMSVAA